jgi:hypothetical protein
MSRIDFKGFENRSQFEKDLIELILKAKENNIKKLKRAYPELVREFRG